MEKTTTISQVLHQASTMQDTTTRSNGSNRNKGRAMAGIHTIVGALANTTGAVAAHKRCHQSPLFLTNRIFRI